MEKDKDLGAVTIEFVQDEYFGAVECGNRDAQQILQRHGATTAKELISKFPHPTAEQEEGIRKHNAARKKLVDEVKKDWEEKQLKKLQSKIKKQ